MRSISIILYLPYAGVTLSFAIGIRLPAIKRYKTRLYPLIAAYPSQGGIGQLSYIYKLLCDNSPSISVLNGFVAISNPVGWIKAKCATLNDDLATIEFTNSGLVIISC